MKILVDGMPRSVGGIGSLILNMAEISRERKDAVEFVFLISDYSDYISILEKNGYRYFIVPRVKDVKQYKEFIGNIFTNNYFDYLWFNNTSKVNIILPEMAKRLGGAKIITHPHGVDFEEKGIKKILFKVLDRINENRMYALIDIPFACSEQAADVYYRNKVELRKKAIIIKNGILVSKFQYSEKSRKNIRADLQCENSDVLLGAVGRLTHVKNYPFIIHMLKDMNDKYKLIIVGEGEEQSQLTKLIREGGLESRCFLLGRKSNVNEYLSAMDYFLLPSLHEGMPYSIIEAQASGVKCIVSDTLSKEVDVTGLVEFVSIKDNEAWRMTIEKKSPNFDRYKYMDIIKKSGYSIEDSYELFRKNVN